MMQNTTLAIPNDLSFGDLKLSREIDGSLSFERSVIERICKASGLSAEIFLAGPEDNLAALIVGWYQAHRNNGGQPDQVAEDLMLEVRAEDKGGQFFSHPPGNA